MREFSQNVQPLHTPSLLQLDTSVPAAKSNTMADGLGSAPIAKAKEQQMKKILTTAIATLGFSSTAFAHPGEHAFNVANSLIHLLTEPDHLAMLALGAAVVGVLIYKRKRSSV
jgi:hypothetical protein